MQCFQIHKYSQKTMCSLKKKILEKSGNTIQADRFRLKKFSIHFAGYMAANN